MWKRYPIIHVALLSFFLIGQAANGQPAKDLNDQGVLAFQARNYDEALENFNKALALEPNSPSLRRNLCAVHQAMANDLAEQGKIDEAQARVAKGLEVDPENPTALTQSGAYFLKSGHLAEATEQLEVAVKLDGSGKEARFLLGEALYQQNKLPEARAQWDEVLKLDPAWPGLQEKLDKLNRESLVEQDFTAYKEGHFELRYAEALSDATRDEVFAALESAYTAVGEKMGGVFPVKPVQVVLYDGKQFTEATQTAAHVGALFDGKIRAPITGKNGRFLSPQVLSTRLTHEYTHVVIAQAGEGHVPWWLNEGLAEVFSREMDLSRKRMLTRAYAGEHAFSLADLENQQLDQLDPSKLAIAYAQAHATTEVLWRTGGTASLSKALKRMKAGATPEQAIKEAYGFDYATLEKNAAAASK